MEDKLQDYKDRHRFWTEISLTQLSNVNNLLLTISTGFLAFCFDKESVKNIIANSTQNYNWSPFFYFASLALIALSITLGIGVLFCRLYDFRISRHLSLTRQRCFKEHSSAIIIDKHKTPETVNLCHRLQTLYEVIIYKFPYVNEKYINDNPKDEKLIDGITKLKRLSKVLGSSSWLWTKIQVLYFFSSVICYATHIWVK